jgi:hypothetical protein
MMINETQMTRSRLPVVIIPVKPSVELDSGEKTMTKVLQGDEVRKWDGIQSTTETNGTTIIYTTSLQIEERLYCSQQTQQ